MNTAARWVTEYLENENDENFENNETKIAQDVDTL